MPPGLSGADVGTAIFYRTDLSPFCASKMPAFWNWFATFDMDLEQVALRVLELMGWGKPEDVRAAGKQQPIVNARSLFCFWAVWKLGETMAGLARNLGLSIPAISKSVVRRRQIAESNGFKLIES